MSYFEKQVGSKCAIHALNHIFQAPLVGDRSYLTNAKYNIQEIDKQCIIDEMSLISDDVPREQELEKEKKIAVTRSGNYSLNSMLRVLKAEGFMTRWVSGICTRTYLSTICTTSSLQSTRILFVTNNHYTVGQFIQRGTNIPQWYHFDSKRGVRPLCGNSSILKQIRQCILVFPRDIHHDIENILRDSQN